MGNSGETGGLARRLPFRSGQLETYQPLIRSCPRIPALPGGPSHLVRSPNCGRASWERQGPFPVKEGNDQGSQTGERAMGAVGANGDSGVG